MSERSQSFFLNPGQWQATLAVGLATGAAIYPWWHGISLWGFCIAALAASTVWHMAYVSRTIVPLPHLAILVAVLQYGAAPWAARFYPAQNPEYSIANFPHYFSYAGPVLIGVVLGWALSCVGLHVVPRATLEARVNARLTRELNWLLWGGIGLKLLLRDREFGGLGFLLVLLANLRFVGLAGLMLFNSPGWKWRAAAVAVLEVSGAVGSGMFHELVLWSLGLFALCLFIQRPSLPKFLTWLLLLSCTVFLLNDAKWQIRAASWADESEVSVFGHGIKFSGWNKPLVGGLCLVQSASKIFKGGYDSDAIGDMILRFNQGWIIERVLYHVPTVEPYAGGETISSAFKASALPRVLARNKQAAGGKVFMERFAGYSLSEDTSMNLGFAGEMYANFGYWGGIAACGVYALCLGLVFRWMTVRAQTSPLWWAIAVYVGHWSLKAETDVGTVLNYLVKSAIVISLVVLALPALRAELMGNQPNARGQRAVNWHRRRMPPGGPASTPAVFDP